MKFGPYRGIPERNEEAGFEWGTLKVDDVGFISYDREEVVIAEKKLSDWIAEFGLPLHLIYAPIMRDNIRKFKKVFEEHYPNGHIRFAGKANAHPSVFKMIAEEGIGADVASTNEMKAAIMGGVPPENLDVNGNAKSDALIDAAVEKNMFFIADSYDEMDTINVRARALGRKARVALRVTGFDVGNVTDEKIFTAGVWSKFGEEVDNVPEVLRNLTKFDAIDFHGFHAHIGSQVTEPDAYYKVIGKLIELSRDLNRAGGNCRLINIGGGFPAEYVQKNEWEYLVERVRAGYMARLNHEHGKAFVWNNEHGGLAIEQDGRINPEVWTGEKMYSDYPQEKMLEKIFLGDVEVDGKTVPLKKALEDLGSPAIVIEPGRSIAENSGITLVKVARCRKAAFNHEMTVVEGNVTNYATAMLLPPVNQWTILTDPYRTGDEPFETFIAGNLCYSGDIISKYKVFLQRKPERGDVLARYYTGAYDPGFFAANTNSFPRPTRILTDENGVVSVIKKRDTFEEIFNL